MYVYDTREAHCYVEYGVDLIMGIIEQKHSSHFIERIGRFDS